jgi:hypothetical protein
MLCVTCVCPTCRSGGDMWLPRPARTGAKRRARSAKGAVRKILAAYGLTLFSFSAMKCAQPSLALRALHPPAREGRVQGRKIHKRQEGGVHFLLCIIRICVVFCIVFVFLDAGHP